jgi:hypothetical protein
MGSGSYARDEGRHATWRVCWILACARTTMEARMTMERRAITVSSAATVW